MTEMRRWFVALFNGCGGWRGRGDRPGWTSATDPVRRPTEILCCFVFSPIGSVSVGGSLIESEKIRKSAGQAIGLGGRSPR